MGLDGIEAIYSRHSERERELYSWMAARHGLLVTGGSDYHGTYKPDINIVSGLGDLRVPYSLLAELKNRALRRLESIVSMFDSLSHLLRGVRGLQSQRKSARNGVAQRLAKHGRLEQRQRDVVPSLPRWRMTQVREPRAHQAVAGLQMVVQKRERPVGGKRRQPQRETGELHGHRVQVDAVQAALGDAPADRGLFGGTEIGRVASSRLNEGTFVGGGEIFTGGNEECAAAHCRVDHLEIENPLGRRIVHERRQRSPDQIVCERLRRVEGAGRLAKA